MQRAITLTLSTPLYYLPSSQSLDELIEKTIHAPVGYDAMIKAEYSFREEQLSISFISSGERNGYTEDEKKIIETGGILARKEEETEEIPAGRYIFEQLPILPEAKILPRIILPYTKEKEGLFYIRLFKESILECIAQLLFPSL